MLLNLIYDITISLLFMIVLKTAKDFGALFAELEIYIYI